MDFVSNLFKKSKSKTVVPQKQAELCDNQNKNDDLIDMETSFLQNTVIIPNECDTDRSSDLNVSINRNQENVKPRYSVLTAFDPILRKASEEEIPSENSTVNLSRNSFDEKSVNSSSDSLNGSKTLVNDQSSNSNYSGQSDNSVLNSTVILNKSLTVENKVPDQILVDKTLNISSLKTNHLSPVGKSAEQNATGTEHALLNIDDGNTLLSSTLNSELSPCNNLGNELITTVEKEKDIHTSDINDSFINALVLESEADNSKPVEILNENKTVTEIKHETIKLEDKCEDNLVSNKTNEILRQINVVSLKLADDLIKEQVEEIFNDENIEININKVTYKEKFPEEKLPLEEKLYTEVKAEEKLPVEVILEQKLPTEIILTEKSSNEVIPEFTNLNETIEIVCNKNDDILFKLNDLTVNEVVNESIDTTENILCPENKNVSFQIICDNPNVTKVLNDLNEEKVKEKPNIQIGLDSTYTNKVFDLADKVISSKTVILEETHMSAPEPNSAVIEPTVANRLSLENSATCTNEMGEIINQNEVYEKQSDISNGAIDNKESLEAKARVFNEMAEKCATAEIECEKYKVLVADLKKELKTCRQKTVALEAEVADLKRRENELNILMEDYKQAAASKSNTKDQDEQLQCRQANEEALKTEVKELKALLKQHETHLKELQRKEVKLVDDLSCKTQSEMQISRVMEEYEKSMSNLISENEKMKKERDTAQMHLANIEMAFSDVHQKYERCKAIVQGYKDNEESFKQDIAMNRETIVIQEQKYETLKAHAMAQLEKSNQELAAMKKQHETEMARLTAQLKRYEIKNMSLMESLQQKSKECEQLSAVCDEFIGNV